LAATNGRSLRPDATSLSRGGSRWPLATDAAFGRMPRACLVEVYASSYIAGNVSLHETSSWHPGKTCRLVAANVNLHDARSWHPTVTFQTRSQAKVFRQHGGARAVGIIAASVVKQETFSSAVYVEAPMSTSPSWCILRAGGRYVTDHRSCL
jgi:hypothetical protein